MSKSHNGAFKPDNEYDGFTSSVARERMIRQLMERGIQDERVLDVMRQIPRHRFVDEALASQTYGDATLPIGEGQTLSAPLTVARMSEALFLSGQEEVLEIGTGSGYQTAVLAKLCAKVYTIERLPKLAEMARKRLRRQLDIHNVVFRVGDGSLGWPEEKLFERIIITAGAPIIPNRLIEQLRPGGILVGPEGHSEQQSLVRLTNQQRGGIKKEILGSCRFVPLVGEEGWQADHIGRGQG